MSLLKIPRQRKAGQDNEQAPFFIWRWNKISLERVTSLYVLIYWAGLQCDWSITCFQVFYDPWSATGEGAHLVIER